MDTWIPGSIVVKMHIYVKLVILFILLVCQPDSFLADDISFTKDQFHCSHKPPSENEVIYDVHLDNGDSGHIQKRSVFQNLRIHLHYDYSVSQLPTSHERLVKKMVTEAVLYWENTLMVRPAVLPVRLNRQCSSIDVRYKDNTRFCVNGCSTSTKCGDILIPEQHLERCYYWNSFSNEYRSSMTSGPGVENKDFVLYIAAKSTSRCGISRTIAYAAHCQQEHQLDRPVAGYFTICNDAISTKKQDHLQLLSTIKHEMLHALGFTAGLYAFFRNDRGEPLTARFPESNKPPFNSHLHLYQWSSKVVKTVVRRYWKVAKGSITHQVNLIVTPRVIEEVRRHFNCPSLEGAELEDQGLIGTHLTHWEKRIFENEAMTGTYTQNPVISRITLALMEDTGWYKANYLMAEHLEWGEGLGCDFVKKSCLDWIDTQRARNGDIHPFCDNVRQGVLKTDCTKNGNAVAFCNLQEYSTPLPPHNQYFNTLPGIHSSNVNRYGGTVALADYCPYLQEFTWRSGERTVRDSRCSMEENNPPPLLNFYGESYGRGSRCFTHTGNWRIQRCNRLHPLSHSGSGCYKYDCERSQGVIVIVNYRSYPCLRSGQKLHVSYISSGYLHDGYIVCPSCQEVCNYRGFICPPERNPYYIANDLPLKVPCGATKIHAFEWTFILFIVLCIFYTGQCQS